MMADDAAVQAHRPPSRFLLLAEGRALAEIALGILARPTLRARARQGDGHTVLVLPGFLASDRSTEFLRGTLGSLGFNAVGWELGRNLGPRPDMRERLTDRVHALARASGGKISVVGWSLGGVYARYMGLFASDIVRCVISLGTPFSGDLRANNVGRLYDIIAGQSVEESAPEEIAAISGHLPVPATSIYSRTDGIVHWRTSLMQEHDQAENIEVVGASHLGLGFNPAVLWAVADRLAQAEGRFRRFSRTGPFGLVYRGAV